MFKDKSSLKFLRNERSRTDKNSSDQIPHFWRGGKNSKNF